MTFHTIYIINNHMKNALLLVCSLLVISTTVLPFGALADTDATLSSIASLLDSLQAAVFSLAEQIQHYGSSQQTNTSDITGDGRVGTDDWNYMESRWFSADETADINGDGIVNSIDFGILNRGWNTTTR